MSLRCPTKIDIVRVRHVPAGAGELRAVGLSYFPARVALHLAPDFTVPSMMLPTTLPS